MAPGFSHVSLPGTVLTAVDPPTALDILCLASTDHDPKRWP